MVQHTQREARKEVLFEIKKQGEKEEEHLYVGPDSPTGASVAGAVRARCEMDANTTDKKQLAC